MDEETVAPGRESVVSLREITGETFREICRLKTTERQEEFVAPNDWSIVEAYFEPKAWMRGIYADETPVGFIMVYDDPEKAHYYLWRFMLDHRYQHMGFGKRALDLLVEHVKTRPNATYLSLSYVPADDGPAEFYHRYGFVDTGEIDDDELVSKLTF